MALALQGSLAITETKEPQTGSMDFETMAGHGGPRVSGWSVVWAMAAAALPKGVEGRQQQSENGVGVGLNWLGQTPQTHRENGEQRQAPFGDTVHLERQEGKLLSPTEAMVRGQNREKEGGQTLHISGKGGWLPWASRKLGVGTQQTQVYQPKGISGQKEGKGGGKSREPKESRKSSGDVRQGNAPVVSRMLEAVSPKVPGRGE